MSRKHLLFIIVATVACIVLFNVLVHYKIKATIAEIVREDELLMLQVVHYDGDSTLTELGEFVMEVTNFHGTALQELFNLHPKKDFPLQGQVAEFLVKETKFLASYLDYVSKLAAHRLSVEYAIEMLKEARLSSGSSIAADMAYEESIERSIEFLKATDKCLIDLKELVKAEDGIIRLLAEHGMERKPVIGQNSNALAEIIEETRKSALVLVPNYIPLK